ncbi:MAG: hypothetical protein AAFZ67_11380 [Planctomycetota bacterium]
MTLHEHDPTTCPWCSSRLRLQIVEVCTILMVWSDATQSFVELRRDTEQQDKCRCDACLRWLPVPAGRR